MNLIRTQMRETAAARQERLEATPNEGANPIMRTLSRVVGIGAETADMLAHEVLSRDLRDRRAVARYAGLTGSPDESGARRREKGLSKAGNARVRRGLIEFAWRFLLFQRESELAGWFRSRVEEGGKRRKTMIVALARKLLVALWRLVHSGDVPRGFVLRPA
jgi:transposase